MQDDELGVNCYDDSAMGFDRELAGCISYLNSNSFDLKWAVVLPGQFAGTFAGPDIYLSFVHSCCYPFDSVLEGVRPNCWHRLLPSDRVFVGLFVRQTRC